MTIPKQLLVREANGTRFLYGGNIYLVGSAIRNLDGDFFRDIDIVAEMSDEAFSNKFLRSYKWMDNETLEDRAYRWACDWHLGFYTKSHWIWADDCFKRSQELSASLGNNVDFKCQSLAFVKKFRHHKRPKIRLDTYPMEYNSETEIEFIIENTKTNNEQQ